LSSKNTTIISGGQSGTDRAALDFALEHKIPCGGYCPRGRKAEDGRIPKHYPLEETAFEGPQHRTKKNVDRSDGTLIICLSTPDEGTRYTLQYARETKKPVYIIKKSDPVNPSEFSLWIDVNKIKVLNVAGPKESNEPGIYQFATETLEELSGNILRY